MSGYLFGAIACFVLSSLFVVGWVGQTRRHKQMYLTESVTPGTLVELHRAALGAAGPDAFGQVVDVTGAAAAGPGGLLRAELSRTPCVWHHHRVVRRFEETTFVDGKQQTAVREETVSELRSETPFAVRDGSGSVLVVPTVGLDGAEKVLDEFDDDRQGSTLGYSRQEWVLTEGTTVFVHAEAVDRGGELTLRDPEGKDRLTITTRTEGEVLAGLRSSARFLLGAAVTLDVVGVVLLVLSLTNG